MSDRLRDALRVMKEVAEQPHALPVTYLHDPETGKMFGALVKPDFMREVDNSYIHGHREGDEDE